MSLSHPWHDIDPGSNLPETVNGIIEIPKGSRAKYELDKETGLITLDRVLYSSIYYPANYGFIPKSYCDDGDPLDILVLSQIDLVPLTLVEATVIGAMRMLDGGEADDKIIAVATNDIGVNHYEDITELPNHFKRELTSFFEDYKKLENKEVIVEDLQSKKVAQEILMKSFEDYRNKFS